jgi:nucleoside-diphosphate-sugar epimerase
MFLVTGGAGFIGSHTAAFLCDRGQRVRVLDDLSSGSTENLRGIDVELHRGDIRDAEAVTRAMRGCTHVVHLAAWPSVPSSCADPIGHDQVNVHGTVIVFEAARRAGVARVVYASSSAVYGSSAALPKHEGLPVHTESPYAAAKAANELYGSTYSRTLGLECVGMRYFNVFGPRQDPNGPYAAVIPRFVECALRGDPLPVHGDGLQGRDFVSVRDVARANWLAATTLGISGRIFNVGAGRMTTIRDLARYVLDTVGGRSMLEAHPARPGDVRFSVSDIARAEVELGFRPEADFDEAMRETIVAYASRLAVGPAPDGVQP